MIGMWTQSVIARGFDTQHPGLAKDRRSVRPPRPALTNGCPWYDIPIVIVFFDGRQNIVAQRKYIKCHKICRPLSMWPDSPFDPACAAAGTAEWVMKSIKTRRLTILSSLQSGYCITHRQKTIYEPSQISNLTSCRKSSILSKIVVLHIHIWNSEVSAPVKYLCGHTLDAPTFTTGGTSSNTAHLGESKKKYPCDDCKANKKWVQQSGKWVKA